MVAKNEDEERMLTPAPALYPLSFISCWSNLVNYRHEFQASLMY